MNDLEWCQNGDFSISQHSPNFVATVVNHHTFTVDARYSLPENKILGVGSYGVVAAAFDSVSRNNIAIKRVRPFAEDDIYAKLSLRELRCLKLMGTHPNVSTPNYFFHIYFLKKHFYLR